MGSNYVSFDNEVTDALGKPLSLGLLSHQIPDRIPGNTILPNPTPAIGSASFSSPVLPTNGRAYTGLKSLTNDRPNDLGSVVGNVENNIRKAPLQYVANQLNKHWHVHHRAPQSVSEYIEMEKKIIRSFSLISFGISAAMRFVPKILKKLNPQLAKKVNFIMDFILPVLILKTGKPTEILTMLTLSIFRLASQMLTLPPVPNLSPSTRILLAVSCILASPLVTSSSVCLLVVGQMAISELLLDAMLDIIQTAFTGKEALDPDVGGDT